MRKGEYDLTLCSCRRVHHLDVLQEPCVVIRRRLLCREVSTANVLKETRTNQSIVPSGASPVIRECPISLRRACLISSLARS